MKETLCGLVFGRLTVVSESPRTNEHDRLWRCVCSCGKAVTVRGGNLKNGHTSSCGCFMRERASRIRRTHGRSNSPEWLSWYGAKQRCYSKNNPAYPRYGGRGIAMCERWREDFSAFYSDMGPRPAGCSLDRIDNDGPYSPENCRWATSRVQSRNTRRNIIATVGGDAMVVTDAARLVGLKRQTVLRRLERGYSLEEALNPAHMQPGPKPKR